MLTLNINLLYTVVNVLLLFLLLLFFICRIFFPARFLTLFF